MFHVKWTSSMNSLIKFVEMGQEEAPPSVFYFIGIIILLMSIPKQFPE